MGFKVKTKVYHGKYGWGVVIQEEDSYGITMVEFKNSVKQAVEESLLSTKPYRMGHPEKMLPKEDIWEECFLLEKKLISK